MTASHGAVAQYVVDGMRGFVSGRSLNPAAYRSVLDRIGETDHQSFRSLAFLAKDNIDLLEGSSFEGYSGQFISALKELKSLAEAKEREAIAKTAIDD